MSEQVREIGGYFGLETFTGSEYHRDLIGLNTARNALVYLLKSRGIRKLYIPVFLCDCVERVCIREGFAYEKYHVGADFLPVFSKELEEGEWLYVVNYYGQLTDSQILQMKAQWDRLIVDHVQDFFRRPLPGVDTLYSCRKFLGVADGAYLSTDVSLDVPQDASRDRMNHVLGRFETSGSAYFSVFQENDEKLYDLPLAAMSPVTSNLLRAVDYAAVAEKRNENFATLAAILEAHNGIHPVLSKGPYCYPFYTQNGMTLKRQLAQQKIYVATLWPNVVSDAFSSDLERDLAQNILPLPCDQRYSPEDMRYMAEHLLALMNI